ncbi:MAG: Asp-tRNA(Asn)/Glu-tRNA(Gln) amidotransferase subunit GatC [Bacillota bacterium]|jgi:aspartyl-tRNA(Asn)/glutamyl-tRNA(Gln) amidotransferase subunit C
MNISLLDIEKLADAAKIALTEAEKTAFQEKMNATAVCTKKIQELDADGIKPTTHILYQENIFREDTVGNCLTNEVALANAPETENGCFKVPKIL